MLSIFDRIKISAACCQGRLEFERKMANAEKEQRRANRAAGKNKNSSTTNTDSDNIGSNQNLVQSDNKKDINSTQTGKKNKSKTSQTSEPKSEQEINAEAQAPEESAGAEKIVAETVVENTVDAAMNGNVHIDDQPGGRLEFMGASIDLNKMGGEQPIAGNVFQQNVPIQTGHPTGGAAVHNPIPQFELNPMDGMNTYGNFINQQGSFNPAVSMINPVMPMINPSIQMQQPSVGHGHHKVDNPAKPKPAKPPKSEPEKVDISGMPNPADGMEVVENKKIDVRTYGEFVTDKIPHEVDPAPVVNLFAENNKAFYHDYPYLVEVEKVALDNGYQIGFAIRHNTNLIECHIYNNDGTPIPGKGFTIDPGMIIDRRKKIFPAIAQFYEGMNAYPLFINNPNTKDDGKKAGNILNVDVLTALIVGGNNAVDTRGMYSEDFRNLNKFVALITIPTEKGSAADRKYIQNRLVDLYKSGVFTDALATVPGSRFRIAEYNKGSGTILLDTAGVPANFGGSYVPNERIQLKVTKDKCKTLRGDNIIDVPEKKNQH